MAALSLQKLLPVTISGALGKSPKGQAVKVSTLLELPVT